jgi:ATP-dependent exoDNAse (exonuclease V) beta subunit
MCSLTNTYLQELNSHPRDKLVEFDEPTHIYTVDGKKDYTSTTTWIHHHFPGFDSDKISTNIMNGTAIHDPTYKYYGMSKHEIMELWRINGEKASKSGTQVHYDIECFYNNNLKKESEDIDFKYFKEFVRDNAHLKPYRTEWCVFNEEWKICGSIDMLYENPDGTLLIYDWKRVRELSYENNYGKSGTPKCINHISDSNFWHYTLQLNTYKAILESKYNKKVTGMFLVCLHPNNYCKTYEVIELQDLTKEITDMVELRKSTLKA